MSSKLGTKLRDAREQEGLSRAEVKEQLKISQRTIGRIENGETSAKPEYLRAFADFYGLDYVELAILSAHAQFRPSESGYDIGEKLRWRKVEALFKRERRRKPKERTKAVVLFSGLHCTGKSTIAKALAEHLHLPFLEKDNVQKGLFEASLLNPGASGLAEDEEEQLYRKAGYLAMFPRGAYFLPVVCECRDWSLWEARVNRRSKKPYLRDIDFEWLTSQPPKGPKFEKWPDSVLSIDTSSQSKVSSVNKIEGRLRDGGFRPLLP